MGGMDSTVAFNNDFIVWTMILCCLAIVLFVCVYFFSANPDIKSGPVFHWKEAMAKLLNVL